MKTIPRTLAYSLPIGNTLTEDEMVQVDYLTTPELAERALFFGEILALGRPDYGRALIARLSERICEGETGPPVLAISEGRRRVADPSSTPGGR